MSFKSLQKQVDRWVSQFKDPYWQPHDILARLTEEMGELARQINIKFGPKKNDTIQNESSIDEELADILFSVICLANSLKIDLDKTFESLIENKCYGRDNFRFERSDKKKMGNNLMD